MPKTSAWHSVFQRGESILKVYPFARLPEPALAAVKWFAITIAVVAVVPVLLLSTRKAPAPGAPTRAEPVPSIPLTLTREGGRLSLRWDREAPAIQAGQCAILWIADGAIHRRLILAASQLRAGKLFYWPVNKDVSFEIQMSAGSNRSGETVCGNDATALLEPAERPAGREQRAERTASRNRLNTVHMAQRRATEATSLAQNFTQKKEPAATIPAPAEQPIPATPAPVRVPANQPEAAAPGPPPQPPRSVTLAAGTLIQARTIEALSTERNQAGDSFIAALDQPQVADGLVIAERGARLEGRVVQSERAGRVKGLSELAIELTQLNTSDRQRLAIETETFAKHGETLKSEDAGKVGTVATIGAVIGVIAGGGKGAGIGAAAGGAAGAGGVMGTRAKAVEIRPETKISFRLKNSITVTERQNAGR